MSKTVEELLQTPYWIIDILPEQVPADGMGQYFAVESYYLQEPQLAAIKQKHINVVLKLNCYLDIFLDDDAAPNPQPGQVAQAMTERSVNIRVKDSLIVSEHDDTHMTIFNPDAQLLCLVKALSAAEGLFVWQPPEPSSAGA